MIVRTSVPFALGPLFVALSASIASLGAAQAPPAGSWGPPVQHNLDVNIDGIVDFPHVPQLGRR